MFPNTNNKSQLTIAATPDLPKLSTEQTLKLRLLSLLSLAVTVKPLTYQSLMTALSLSSTAELESLVTTAIYASLITARLSPATNPPTVTVTAVAPLRDVQPQSLPKMITLLTQWEARCGEVVSDLEAEIARVKENAEKRHAKERAYQMQLEEVTKRRQAALEGSNAGGVRTRAGAYGRGVPRNKREADDIDHDGWESDSGARMDIDDGAGSRGGTRHSKRLVGRKA